MTIPWWLLSDFCLFVAAFIIGRWAGRWEGRDEMLQANIKKLQELSDRVDRLNQKEPRS